MILLPCPESARSGHAQPSGHLVIQARMLIRQCIPDRSPSWRALLAGDETVANSILHFLSVS
jgi:hypothetical protein